MDSGNAHRLLTALDFKFFSLSCYSERLVESCTTDEQRAYGSSESSGAASGIELHALFCSLPGTLLNLSVTISPSSCGPGSVARGDSGRKIVFSAASFLHPKQMLTFLE